MYTLKFLKGYKKSRVAYFLDQATRDEAWRCLLAAQGHSSPLEQYKFG